MQRELWAETARLKRGKEGAMAGIRSKRLKLLEGLRRTLCDRLHERIGIVARARGWLRPPDNTSAIYTLAAAEAPALLGELLAVHVKVSCERSSCGEAVPSVSDTERKRMLSAVRACVARSYR
jgi:hypothetical protein